MEENKKGLRVKTIIEIVGSPKDHVEEALQLILEKLKDSKEKFTILEDKTFEAAQMGDKPLWSTFAEIKMEVKNMETLLGYCFDFMPSSIEFVEEEAVKISHKEAENIMNDLLARLHQYDMLLKNIHAQNIILKKELEKKKEA